MILDSITHVRSSLFKEFKDIPGCNQYYRWVTKLLAHYKLVKEHSLILCNSKFTYMEGHRSCRRNFCRCEKRHEKIQACTGFEPLTSTIPVQRSYQLSQQANREQVVKLVRYKLVKGWRWSCDWIYENHINENCGVKNCMEKDHPVTEATFCSCKKRAWKNSGLYGIRTLDLLLRVLFWFIT